MARAAQARSLTPVASSSIGGAMDAPHKSSELPPGDDDRAVGSSEESWEYLAKLDAYLLEQSRVARSIALQHCEARRRLIDPPHIGRLCHAQEGALRMSISSLNRLAPQTTIEKIADHMSSQTHRNRIIARKQFSRRADNQDGVIGTLASVRTIDAAAGPEDMPCRLFPLSPRMMAPMKFDVVSHLQSY